MTVRAGLSGARPGPAIRSSPPTASGWSVRASQPRGMTRYGWRKQQEQRQALQAVRQDPRRPTLRSDL